MNEHSIPRHLLERAEGGDMTGDLPDYCPSCGTSLAEAGTVYLAGRSRAPRCRRCEAPLTGTADWLETELDI